MICVHVQFRKCGLAAGSGAEQQRGHAEQQRKPCRDHRRRASAACYRACSGPTAVRGGSHLCGSFAARRWSSCCPSRWIGWLAPAPTSARPCQLGAQKARRRVARERHGEAVDLLQSGSIPWGRSSQIYAKIGSIRRLFAASRAIEMWSWSCTCSSKHSCQRARLPNVDAVTSTTSATPTFAGRQRAGSSSTPAPCALPASRRTEPTRRGARRLSLSVSA